MPIRLSLRSIFLFLVCLLPIAQCFAQIVPPQSWSAVLQQWKSLGTFGSVLYIAAHPDDENTRMISYLVGDRHLRTAYLSLTRGDGGQNLIGSEQGVALGLIRTQELLEARKIDGAEQYFTRAYDFGYSKTPEETFAIWNKDSILHDVVWVIRHFQPDVIITRFPTNGEGGHGHHTASAMLALEAFKAAADANQFPEQLKSLSVWQAKRIYWNRFAGRSTASEKPLAQLLNVGTYQPEIGRSCGEIAALSRSQHKSQGFGAQLQYGELMEALEWWDGVPHQNDFLHDIGTKPMDKGFPKEWESLCQKAWEKKYGPLEPKALELALELWDILQTMPASVWKKTKMHACAKLIAALCGLKAELMLAEKELVAGKQSRATLGIVTQVPITSARVHLRSALFSEAWDESMPLSPGRWVESEPIVFRVPSDFQASMPYWLRNPLQKGRFQYPSLAFLQQAQTQTYRFAELTLVLEGRRISFSIPVHFKEVDPVKGELHFPPVILPEVLGKIADDVLVFAQGQSIRTRLFIEANAAASGKLLRLSAPEFWKIQPESIVIKEGKQEYELCITAPKQAVGQLAELQVNIVNPDGLVPLNTKFTIAYDHIEAQTYLQPMRVTLSLALKAEAKGRIAYIPGAGDRVAECLRKMGYIVDEFMPEALVSGQLTAYKAVVVGVRAYNTHDAMAAAHPILMDYVQQGGTLLLQYNTKNWVSQIKTTLGPEPFEISRNRITDEQAPVTILLPKHPLLNKPNKIASSDFDGWVQERGLYFPEQISKNYHQIIAMQDPDEAPLKSGILYMPYGKGHYIYTSLSFFRQLPAGVPGAYRLLQNLLEVSSK